jgi:PAS domain S-box-containing protein
MSEPFLLTVLESLTEGVFTVDRDWKITSFNRAAEKITGISRQDAIARNCCDVFRASACNTGCPLKRAVQTKRSATNLRIQIKNKAGVSLPVSISTAVLKDWNGEVVGGVETFRDLSAVESLKKEIEKQYTFKDIVGKNPKMHYIFKVLPRIAGSDSTVLIQGASGTGKELFARAIHNISKRRTGPFVVVNCGALPDPLLESELFGYVGGAFTGAKKSKPGRFTVARGGTIFLDEIGDISPSVQVKLLRILQENTYEPLGSNKTLKANARIIAATNRNLPEMIREGTFRDDMYYRISVVTMDLPKLSERIDDIPYLIQHFMKKLNIRTGKEIVGVSNEVAERLVHYDFPGNVRELENIMEHAFVLCHGDTIELEHLPWDLERSLYRTVTPLSVVAKKPFENTEAELIRHTLKKYYGHRGRTAKELGIHKTTLWRKIKKYHLHDNF